MLLAYLLRLAREFGKNRAGQMASHIINNAMLTSTRHDQDMEERSITLSLPQQVWDALLHRDLPLEQAIAQTLQAHHSCEPQGIDPVSISDLEEKLATHFEDARTWPELQGRLKLLGFTLRDAHGEIYLFETATRQRVCGLSRLGQTELGLSAKFGRPFPRAIQRWQHDAMLDGAAKGNVGVLTREQAFRSATRGG